MLSDTFDLIRTWECEGFKLELYDTYQTRYGKSILAYRFFDHANGVNLVFEGADYGCSPLHAIDSDAALADLLGFLSLRPGDTDSEWFESYTPAQLEWCQSGRAEWLQVLQTELEEGSSHA